ncbi:triose-phosphate isomerase [Lacticaseibacillus hegangensis]|uniref:Triose-phosphate isomerase n=1 Tax=Lacticaseibacillus hegangensis TaxID=2486010 RepID=A0ABW4CZ21_9LACO|nr:triose-phosphate isomerase [Lacticaseibacillus hegangensis]
MKKPFFIVNPKSYLYGTEILKLARLTDKVAAKYNIDVMFTAKLIDFPEIMANTSHLIYTAQHMDALTPGRGMGKVLPVALKNRGIQAVVLNHAEHPLTLAQLDASMVLAKDLGLMTIVCSDTVAQSRAIAELHPTAMICEPTSLIGTGSTSNDQYIKDTDAAIRSVDPAILIMQAAGVSSGEDVKKVMALGADGSGATSGIIKAPDWESKLDEMIGAAAQFSTR